MTAQLGAMSTSACVHTCVCVCVCVCVSVSVSIMHKPVHVYMRECLCVRVRVNWIHNTIPYACFERVTLCPGDCVFCESVVHESTRVLCAASHLPAQVHRHSR